VCLLEWSLTCMLHGKHHACKASKFFLPRKWLVEMHARLVQLSGCGRFLRQSRLHVEGSEAELPAGHPLPPALRACGKLAVLDRLLALLLPAGHKAPPLCQMPSTLCCMLLSAFKPHMRLSVGNHAWVMSLPDSLHTACAVLVQRAGHQQDSL
jgi:hypothetical protein